MADIQISKSSGKRYIGGNIPSSSSNTIDGDPNPIISPPSGSGVFVPYTGAIGDVDLGIHSLEASTIVKSGGLATQALLANGSVLDNPVSGTGTTNYLAKFTASGVIGDSAIFENGGNVGIGTDSPTQALTVNGNAAVGGQQAFWLRDDDGFSSSSARRAWAITANNVELGMLSIYGASAANSNPLSGTPHINITSTGNLLLNTTTDNGARLQVNGTGYFSGDVSAVNTGTPIKIIATGINSGTAGGSSIIAGTSGVTNIAIGNRSAILGGAFDSTSMIYWGNSGSLVFNNGADRLTITSTGNVGIGTSNPLLNLQINSATDTNSTLCFSENNTLKWYIRNSAANDSLQFVDVTSSDERMRITSTGNLLLNTTTDNGARLQVNGKVNFLALPTSSAGLVSGDLWRNGTVINIIP